MELKLFKNFCFSYEPFNIIDKYVCIWKPTIWLNGIDDNTQFNIVCDKVQTRTSEILSLYSRTHNRGTQPNV